jgi:predicted lipid-binding transport protein (Tim44 family)
MAIDIVVLAAIAIFILLRLYGILGQQMGHDKPPAADKSFDNDSKVIELAPKQIEKAVNDNERFDGFTEELQENFKEIYAKDKSFRTEDFLNGAKAAFEMVIEAIQKDDRETLQMLLAKDLYEACLNELKSRSSQEEYSVSNLIAILQTEIIEAKLEKDDAIITVRFVSEQIQTTLDSKGEKVAGYAAEIENVEDNWTFKRNLRSSNPNWLIIST